MRVESRIYKNVTNLLVMAESDLDDELLNKLGQLEELLQAELRLTDDYGEYYILIKGVKSHD